VLLRDFRYLHAESIWLHCRPCHCSSSSRTSRFSLSPQECSTPSLDFETDPELRPHSSCFFGRARFGDSDKPSLCGFAAPEGSFGLPFPRLFSEDGYRAALGSLQYSRDGGRVFPSYTFNIMVRDGTAEDLCFPGATA
jgi:hypothetical protein